MKLTKRMKSFSKSKHFKSSIIALFLSSGVLIWLGLKLHEHYYATTNNAYINANIVRIAPRVTGRVNEVFVKNNQFVKEGQLLFTIDPTPFVIALQKADAKMKMEKIKFANAKQMANRKSSLLRRNYISSQEHDDVVANLETTQAALQLAIAEHHQAELNLRWTKLTAPTSGWVSNFSLRDGDMLTANQPYFALISDAGFWADANFKETEIGGIKPGQPASIKIDMYPGVSFKGKVDSISGNTGSVFSLLPPQNATGNWVKVTQRIPVKVLIIDPNPKYPLRVGSSATVTVNK